MGTEPDVRRGQDGFKYVVKSLHKLRGLGRCRHARLLLLRFRCDRVESPEADAVRKRGQRMPGS